MAGSVWQQQAFAIDARLNAHRVSKHPNLKTLYIRRRNQLLRENTSSGNEQLRKQYVKLRSYLLQARYNVSLDTMSVNKSVRGSANSVISTPDLNLSATNIWNEQVLSENEVVPTSQAEASRAIVGDTSISENYAFAGVHHIFDQHTGAVSMIKFAHNDRDRLCAVSYDATMSICNVTTCQVEHVFQGHDQPLTGCDWSASNDLIATCSLDKSVRIWSVGDKVCLRKVLDLTGHEMYACLFHPAGNGNGLVAVVNVSTGIYIKGGNCKVGGKVLSLAVDASGHVFWAGTDKGVVMSILCDNTGRLSKGKRLILSADSPITSLSWRSWISREARDPSLLVNVAVANAVCILKVLDKEGGVQLKRKFSVNHRSSKYQVRSTFCPIMSFREGACVVTGSEDSCVYFLDIQKESKNVVNKLQGHACPVLGVSFNYDESLLATSDSQGLIILWSREKS